MVYQKRYRLDRQPRMIAATGTRRRVEALHALGYSSNQIAQRLGWTARQVQFVRKSTNVFARTAEKVSRLYDEIGMTPPEPNTPAERMSVTRTQRWARGMGFVPPLAWDDIDNDPAPAEVTHMRHRSTDLLAEYEHLIACGESHEQALRQLGVQADAIHTARIRARRSDAA